MRFNPQIFVGGWKDGQLSIALDAQAEASKPERFRVERAAVANVINAVGFTKEEARGGRYLLKGKNASAYGLVPRGEYTEWATYLAPAVYKKLIPNIKTNNGFEVIGEPTVKEEKEYRALLNLKVDVAGNTVYITNLVLKTDRAIVVIELATEPVTAKAKATDAGNTAATEPDPEL